MAHVLSEETSLTRKRDSLQSETGALGFLIKAEAVLAVALLLAGSVYLVTRGESSLLWVGVAVAAVSAGHYMKIKDNKTEEKKTEAGLKGESKVSGMLAASLDNTHYIFNDVLVRLGRKSAQIDHLVVSPGGIFILETKNWRGLIEGDEYDERWKQFKAPGEDPILISNPVHQCARHLAVITGALKRAGIKWEGIHPLVVFMPRTELAIKWQDTPVLHPNDAVEYVKSFVSDHSYSEEQVSAVLNFFMKAIGRA